MTSFLDRVVPSDEPLEKMSKSRGNAVSVDMVVNGVATIEPGYEWRDVNNDVITKWKRLAIWRHRQCDGFFYCGASLNRINRQLFGHRFPYLPVFLCIIGERWPARLLIDGVERMQHPRLVEFWNAAAKADPDEFYNAKSTTHHTVNDYTRAGVYCKHG